MYLCMRVYIEICMYMYTYLYVCLYIYVYIICMLIPSCAIANDVFLAHLVASLCRGEFWLRLAGLEAFIYDLDLDLQSRLFRTKLI